MGNIPIDSFIDMAEVSSSDPPASDPSDDAMIIAAVGEFVSAHIAELGDKLAAAVITATPSQTVEAAVSRYTRALEGIREATLVVQQTKDENHVKEQKDREEARREASRRYDSDS